MPGFRPMIPPTALACLLELDFSVDARSQIELAEGIDRLLRRLEDVEQALVRANLELLARFLVDVWGAVHREALDMRRQRNGPRDPPTRAANRLHDLTNRLVEEPVIVCLQANA